eukprot:5930534-Ditylum_brightwellii.AAC.1
MIGIDNNIATVENPKKKPIARVHAEMPLWSIMGFILAVASSQLIIGKPPKGHPALKKKDNMGAQFIYIYGQFCV